LDNFTKSKGVTVDEQTHYCGEHQKEKNYNQGIKKKEMYEELVSVNA
jgi:hypothetical protein